MTRIPLTKNALDKYTNLNEKTKKQILADHERYEAVVLAGKSEIKYVNQIKELKEKADKWDKEIESRGFAGSGELLFYKLEQENKRLSEKVQKVREYCLGLQTDLPTHNVEAELKNLGDKVDCSEVILRDGAKEYNDI